MNFAKVFFIEHIRVSASDVRMQLKRYLEPWQISMMELFRENGWELAAVNCFPQKSSIIYVSESSNPISLALSFSCIVNKIT